MTKKKWYVTGGCLLIAVVLQALLIGLKQLTALLIPALSGKMLTMCVMILLWLLSVGFICLRRVRIPVFPKPFRWFSILTTAVAGILLIAAPSNYTVGLPAVAELFYGSVVTPVYEETVFRGYVWERTKSVFQSEKSVFLITAILFSVWHIGYMIPALLSGDWFAVGTKLAAGLIYGLVLGFVRLKCGNLYLPVLIHGIMNLFMI